MAVHIGYQNGQYMREMQLLVTICCGLILPDMGLRVPLTPSCYREVKRNPLRSPGSLETNRTGGWQIRDRVQG